jgi:inhibitor of cysteine peptidase
MMSYIPDGAGTTVASMAIAWELSKSIVLKKGFTMKWRQMLCAVLAMSMFLFACSAKGSIEVTCDDFQDNHHPADDIEVKVGDEFTITLCSNPTTGYQWSEGADISGDGIVDQTGHEYVAPDEGDQPPLVGTAGEEVWRFKALAAGESSISVEYNQPWDGGEKGTWTFVLNVIVK